MTQLTDKERTAQMNGMRSFDERGESLYQLSGDARRVEGFGCLDYLVLL